MLASAADYLADLAATDDALVLASSVVEGRVRSAQRLVAGPAACAPETTVEVLRLPHSDPSPELVDEPRRQAERSRGSHRRPGCGCSGYRWSADRVKLRRPASGRDTHRPPEILQRAILKRTSSRARIVVRRNGQGLRNCATQWRRRTTGETQQDSRPSSPSRPWLSSARNLWLFRPCLRCRCGVDHLTS